MNIKSITRAIRRGRLKVELDTTLGILVLQRKTRAGKWIKMYGVPVPMTEAVRNEIKIA